MPLRFTAWKAKRAEYPSMDETELLDSFAWKAFLRRVVQLPAGKSFVVTDQIQLDSRGVAVNGNNRETSDARPSQPTFVSGFRVGLYMIVAERFCPNKMYFINVEDRNSNDGIQSDSLPTMRYLDRRLSWRNFKENMDTDIYMSLKHEYFFTAWTNSEPYRYVVLIPRVIVDDATLREVLFKYLRKCSVVVGLLLVVAVFSALRYLCQRTTVKSISPLDHLFLDTFARSIGSSAGPWLGRSRSERQLLVVIGVFAFLFGSIFSGALFEQLLTEAPLHFLYNSLDDVCSAKLGVSVQIEVFDHLVFSAPEKLR